MGTYIAHRSHVGENEREQLLADHLTNVADMAKRFATSFAADLAYECGLVHDVGKYSDEFQKRIHGASFRTDHATAGGQLLLETYRDTPCAKLAKLMAYCVMGHHGGLPNGGTTQDDSDSGTLSGRLQKKIPSYAAYQMELQMEPRLKPLDFTPKNGFGVAFLTRMVYSALVDADWLDTEAFCNDGGAVRGGFSSIAELQKRLSLETERFLHAVADHNELNMRRNDLLRNCMEKASHSSGVFTLTAPTGSGKTIASLAFALNHAVAQGKKRVIYIVPYNTIIEQNAAVFEKVLGQENVLRHYSDVDYDDDENEIARNKHHSVENWDYPLIVTSSVQFFESLFANKSSRCRKLHNIAESVLIFDEAQMIPQPYLTPCVKAIRELVEHYACTAVLATATQSALDRHFNGMKIKEIAENPKELYTALKRAKIQILQESLTEEALAKRLAENKQVLCIVNTRKKAQSLYQVLLDRDIVCEEGMYHLSTTMYPAHRKRVLEEIRSRLKDDLQCCVISTSLVEAGVDLDFETVYRERAGLDSVVQAAGRCNRENKRNIEDSIVYVFTMTEGTLPQNIQPNIDAMRQVERKYTDVAEPEAIKAYFERLYYNKGEEALDAKDIVKAFDDGLKNKLSFPFKEVAKQFRLIDDKMTKMVYILKEVPNLEEQVREVVRCGDKRERSLFRTLGAYGVSLYKDTDYKALEELGAIEVLDEQIALLSREYYDECYGVTLSPEGGQGIFV
ncbi:CRISPR-associated helicase/endonuclease Cas3 [Clostridia bacterium]|nr:CRISPR-associated helicase/endonuclease Cas3 [Clostridia bacterium]